MGFRYRRTKSKGPLRVSVGKRGVSASVGTKGFRVGITSSGKIRTTNSIPGTGISYTNTFGGKKKKGGQRSSTYSSPSPYQGNTQINYPVNKSITKSIVYILLSVLSAAFIIKLHWWILLIVSFYWLLRGLCYLPINLNASIGSSTKDSKENNNQAKVCEAVEEIAPQTDKADYEEKQQSYPPNALNLPKVGSPQLFQNNFDRSMESFDDFTVIDIETTGLLISLDYIVEISALKVRANKIVDTFSSYIKPPKPIPENATAIHGITNEMVETAPSSDEVMQKWLNFIGDDVLVGHNIGKFDLPIIKRYAYFNNAYVDTLKLAKSYCYDAPNNKLQTLCDYFGIINENAHNSLSDCKADYELYLKIKEKKYDQEHSIRTTLVSGSKLAQNNIEQCHIGDELSFAYNQEKSKFEIFKDSNYIGYLSNQVEDDFVFNMDSISSIKISSFSEIKKGKSVLIKIELLNGFKRYYTENVELISNKSINQQALSETMTGVSVIIKLLSEKYYFYFREKPNVEIGYAPKSAMPVLCGIEKYRAKIVNIRQDDSKIKATIRIDYSKNADNPALIDITDNFLNV